MATYRFTVLDPSGSSTLVTAATPRKAAALAAKEASLPAALDYPGPRDRDAPRWRVMLADSETEVTPTWLFVQR